MATKPKSQQSGARKAAPKKAAARKASAKKADASKTDASKTDVSKAGVNKAGAKAAAAAPDKAVLKAAEEASKATAVEDRRVADAADAAGKATAEGEKETAATGQEHHEEAPAAAEASCAEAATKAEEQAAKAAEAGGGDGGGTTAAPAFGDGHAVDLALGALCQSYSHALSLAFHDAVGERQRRTALVEAALARAVEEIGATKPAEFEERMKDLKAGLDVLGAPNGDDMAAYAGITREFREAAESLMQLREQMRQ